MPELSIHALAHSEIGLVRKNNQDSGYASSHLLLVADGMGGAAAGDLASAVAVQLISKADRPARGEAAVTGDDMLEILAGAINQANDRIADLVAEDPSLEGMGTTVTAALFDGHQLGLAHIGDSRAYLLRDGEMVRLTHDHSWVQSLVDEGKISEEEAAYHPHRSLLLKVLNGQPANDPDTGLVDVHPGDLLLFCSDGLCGLVDDTELAEILTAAPEGTDLARTMDALVDAAHREGGIDNITIILGRIAPCTTTPGDARLAGSAAPGPAPLGEVSDDGEPTQIISTGSAPDPEATDGTVIGAATERHIPPLLARSQAAEPPAAPAEDRPAAPPRPSHDDETRRYAPRIAPRRMRVVRVVVAALAVLALVAAGLGGGYAWAKTQYFVGSAGEQVAIYRGLPQEVLGYPLSEVYEVQETRIADLPQFYQQRVRQSIESNSLQQARNTAGELKTAADNCIRQRAERAAPPSAPPTPGSPESPAPESPAPSTPTGEGGDGC